MDTAAQILTYILALVMTVLVIFIRNLLQRRDKSIETLFRQDRAQLELINELEKTMLRNYVPETAFNLLRKDIKSLETKFDDKFDKIMLKIGHQ